MKKTDITSFSAITWKFQGSVFENAKNNQNIPDSLIVANEQNENQVLGGQ